MRFEIYVLMTGCLALFLAAPACSLIDEPEPEIRTAGQEPDRGREVRHHGKADRSAPDGACATDAECPARPHTASWCSDKGQCQYACEPGFGDANAEEEVDGCECVQQNGAQEVCNGIDDDCDGVVDNPFAGGQLAAGRSHSCAIDATGALSCWGAQTLDPASQDADFDSASHRFWTITAGVAHSCGLTAAGRVYCWGSNRYGQRGPQPARHRDDPTPLAGQRQYVDVSAGGYHSCGLTGAGRVYCWGRNDVGQLGDGTVTGRAAPKKIASSLEFVDVSAGEFHTCATSATGDVLCWGANVSGQAGQLGAASVNAPSPVRADEAFVAVAAGANHSCALTAAGRAFCWGANNYAQGGDGGQISGPEVRPVDADVEFAALSLGAGHSCGLSSSGRLYCWGLEEQGRLGIEVPGEVAPRPRPVGAGLRFSTVAAGARHTCAMSTFGHVYCWGDGRHGQLVPNKTSSSRRPWRVDCR